MNNTEHPLSAWKILILQVTPPTLSLEYVHHPLHSCLGHCFSSRTPSTRETLSSDTDLNFFRLTPVIEGMRWSLEAVAYLGRWKKGLTYRHRQHSKPPTFPTATLQESKILFSPQTLFHHTNHTFCFSHTLNFWAGPQGLVFSSWEDTAQSICSTQLSAVPAREKSETVLLPDGCQLALLRVFQLQCNPYFSTNYSPSTCRHTQGNVISHWSEPF